tara:strand:- start:1025 stop:1393 length:369 start_codon:yes stop_codon:yes gene_type:complete
LTKKKNNPIKTVLTIVIGFAAIYMITKLEWILILALSIGIIGLVSNRMSIWIDLVWVKLTWVLSLIVPNILLSLFFYLLLFPIALLSKLFGNKDPLTLKNKSNSLFVSVDKKFDKESFEKIW